MSNDKNDHITTTAAARRHSKDFVTAAEEIKALGPKINPPVPNPAPVALFAFGLTTALLQVKHTRLGGSSVPEQHGVDYFCFGFALFFGGLLQFVGGLTEIRRNNVFGYTGFLTYGGFWMSYGASLFFVNIANLEVNKSAVQAMLALMGIFTFVLLLCTIVMHVTISLLLFLLMMTFFLLAAGVENETVDIVGGYFGLATSAVAYWLASAELVNDVIGKGKKTIIPLGEWSRIFENRQKVSHVQPHDESTGGDVEDGLARDIEKQGESFYKA